MSDLSDFKRMIHDPMERRLNSRIRQLEIENNKMIYKKSAADKMACEVDRLIYAGKLNARSPLADARLSYSEPEKNHYEQQLTGVERIAAERKRQIEEEGWTAEHDDQWTSGNLGDAGACYALSPDVRNAPVLGRELIHFIFPFAIGWWKPTPEDRIRELEKAGALIAAEIDRLQRRQNEKP